ncbi:lipase [Sphaerisporangium rufum]|uniref:Lipase n=1 Tax=Sphaerisporangium rufum TaxID=1381558 RepID=A0A919R9F4_9ACTN|nr:SGNH/GDSL hydrolase family protein [Sphaerisporangium rufum]GII81844.1 lipase [Sphaerisporangium rufum]
MRPLRVTAVLAVLAGLASVALSAETAHAAGPSVPLASPAHRPALATAHTAGRVQPDGQRVRYSWPGVYFEGRFRGTGVGVVLDDAANDYDVQIDGATVATLVTPGRTTYWVRDLRRGTHDVRLVKRTESPGASGAFGGFVAAPGGTILGRPAPRHRQIEFIGDSYTAGYGNTSDSRECDSAKLARTSNADVSFGALTARRLHADYQLNAFSGRGMVRNYNGIDPEVNFRTYYDRALLNVDGDVWRDPGTWRPQLVVVGLGINDFSTGINPGEPWTPETLVAAYRDAYHGFLDKLRARYGPRTTIVVSATYVYGTTAFADSARQVVQERNDRGDDRIRYWYYEESGLDYMGCDWHPSQHDHQVIADRLGAYIATLPLRW